MKKTLLILSLISFPFALCAQTADDSAKVLVEKYSKYDQELIDAGKKQEAELNKELDMRLKNMSEGQKKALAGYIKNFEKKRGRISGDNEQVIEIKGDDDAAIKDYFNKMSAPELYVPLNKPELVEVDVDELK